MGGNWLVDETLAAAMAELFQSQTVMDLGAGLGPYGQKFAKRPELKIHWVGFDGAMNVVNMTEGRVQFMDLTQPDAWDTRPCANYDWVMSLEVAEHIPPRFEQAYLRNVRCHAARGAVVSWGTPAQGGGLGHVNLKEPAAARAALEQWGFVMDEIWTAKLRAAATMNHFRVSTTVYRVQKRK